MDIRELTTISRELTMTLAKVETLKQSMDPARRVILDDISGELKKSINEISRLIKTVYNKC